jgi:hypothetical protein
VKRQKIPSNRQVATILRYEITVLRDSYTDLIGPHKGRITNVDVLHEIACLKRAIQIVRHHPGRVDL